jgi:hypothetical protein
MALTNNKTKANPKQNTMGPAKSASSMISGAGRFNGFKTVNDLARMWDGLMPISVVRGRGGVQEKRCACVCRLANDGERESISRVQCNAVGWWGCGRGRSRRVISHRIPSSSGPHRAQIRSKRFIPTSHRYSPSKTRSSSAGRSSRQKDVQERYPPRKHDQS